MVASISNETYAIGLARAFGGAVLFAFPLLMTMEMWDLASSIQPVRLALFLAVSLPFLLGLSYYSGFRETFGWLDDALDALASLAVGFIAAFVLLVLFGVVTPDDSLYEAAAKTALQGVPAAIGALLARRQLRGGEKGGPDDPEEEIERREGYLSQLFLMLAGALFVAFNVAPTEEVSLIAFQSSSWLTLALLGVSIVALHAIVYTVGFAGQEAHENPLQAALHYTVPGYAIALAASLYVLWTFGRTDGVPPGDVLRLGVVLAFPGALGAAAARLLV
ncbi:TIGR02587 family membrane protein [Phenylobacterium terrae]|uniref:TIGR02587 family membrane protein n=1 Tax=Phenylobacterium terrae TaxID=2665495 RepID=A0ABW4MY19_9CAUL